MKKLTLNEYQRRAMTTCLPGVRGDMYYMLLKLCSEAGEGAGKMGKYIREDFNTQEEYEEALKLELGDVLWYVAGAADALGITLDQLAKANLNKLQKRHKAGTIKGSGDNR